MIHAGVCEVVWPKLTERFPGKNCEHNASWTMSKDEMNFSPGKPRYYFSDVENGFSTDTNMISFLSLTVACFYKK